VTPKELVKTWVDVFNTADASASALAAMYHEDAVNHQVVTDPIEGREQLSKCSLRHLPKPRWCASRKIFLKMENGRYSSGRIPLAYAAAASFM
jgi:hypothetical protein